MLCYWSWLLSNLNVGNFLSLLLLWEHQCSLPMFWCYQHHFLNNIWTFGFNTALKEFPTWDFVSWSPGWLRSQACFYDLPTLPWSWHVGTSRARSEQNSAIANWLLVWKGRWTAYFGPWGQGGVSSWWPGRGNVVERGSPSPGPTPSWRSWSWRCWSTVDEELPGSVCEPPSTCLSSPCCPAWPFWKGRLQIGFLALNKLGEWFALWDYQQRVCTGHFEHGPYKEVTRGSRWLDQIMPKGGSNLFASCPHSLWNQTDLAKSLPFVQRVSLNCKTQRDTFFQRPLYITADTPVNYNKKFDISLHWTRWQPKSVEKRSLKDQKALQKLFLWVMKWELRRI